MLAKTWPCFLPSTCGYICCYRRRSCQYGWLNAVNLTCRKKREPFWTKCASPNSRWKPPASLAEGLQMHKHSLCLLISSPLNGDDSSTSLVGRLCELTYTKCLDQVFVWQSRVPSPCWLYHDWRVRDSSIWPHVSCSLIRYQGERCRTESFLRVLNLDVLREDPCWQPSWRGVR